MVNSWMHLASMLPYVLGWQHMGIHDCFERVVKRMGDRMEKYWDECSKEEHEEVEQIEKKIAELYEQFESGAINHKKFSYRRTRLRKKIDEVWQKYEEAV